LRNETGDVSTLLNCCFTPQNIEELSELDEFDFFGIQTNHTTYSTNFPMFFSPEDVCIGLQEESKQEQYLTNNDILRIFSGDDMEVESDSDEEDEEIP